MKSKSDFLVFNANWNTFAFHRFTPWYGRFNTFISRMIESGLFNFWEERSVSQQSKARQYQLSLIRHLQNLEGNVDRVQTQGRRAHKND